MLSRFKRANRAALMERGATDPTLIVAGIAITLVLILGGTFAVSGFIGNAQNLNAKSDLDRVAVAQAAAMTHKDGYLPLAWGEKVRDDRYNEALSVEPIGFIPSDGVNLVVRSSPSGWAALIESASGTHFLRTSLSTETVEVDITDIREDFDIVPKNGAEAFGSVDDNGSATTTGESAVLRFPEGVSKYQMAWSWVDAIWGLDASVNPPDGPAPSPNPTTPEPEETEEPSPAPSETTPVEPVYPPFQAGPGNYEIKSVNWNQMAATQVCVDVTVRGTGGLVENWYVTMNAATAPFNHGFDKNAYQFPVWGYGFEGDFQDGRIKVIGQNFSQWNNFSTLTEGQERTLRICNYNTPKPPVTSEVIVTKLSEQPGEWNWNTRYRISAPDAQFYTSWKVRVDLTSVNAGYRGTSPIHSDPGANDLKVTHIEGNIYEIEGIGWPTTGVRSDRSVEFRLGR